MAKVTWTFQALEDLADIGEYHSQHSEKYASYLLDLILESGNQLEQFPRMGRIVPESNIPSVRERIVKNYRIIYSLPDVDTVDNLTVRHTSRPLGDL